MKQIFSTAALLTLTACSTGQIATDVKVDSYQEEYDREVVTSPVMSDVEEVTLAEAPVELNATEAPVNTEPNPVLVAAVEPEPVVVEKIAAKETQDFELNARFVGYTIQVAAFDSQERFNNYVETIPTIKPVWKHTKNVNGKRMYAVLVGQYDTFLLAQKGAAEVSAQMGISAPYIRNVKRITNSDSPDVVQIK